nr:Uma2 family endonuclease [Gloeobacter kilaueensis]
MVAANVGLFYALNRPPLVPDAFLSLNVQLARDWWQKQNRSYFFWEFGKPPEVVIEIVSNTEGNERGSKFSTYAAMRVPFYAIYDPLQQLKGPVLEIFELSGLDYVSRTSTWLDSVGIGLTLWQGEFEGREDTWLRWCDREGQVVPSGAERAAQEQVRAEQERARADALAERLRQLGIDPNEL